MNEVKICMFNTYSSNVAGYCRRHKKYMTVKQIKCMNCLQKQCWHLEKNEMHKWWKQRAEKKQLRKERKERFA